MVVANVSGQPIGRIFKGQTVHLSSTLVKVNDRLSRNVGKYQSTVRNIPEEREISSTMLYTSYSVTLLGGGEVDLRTITYQIYLLRV
jgi:hypothetical protein